MRLLVVGLALYGSLLVAVRGKIEQLPIPSKMQECFNSYAQKTSITETVGESISSFCFDQYIWRAARDHGWRGFNLTTEAYTWANSLLRMNHGNRKKRQGRPLRVRKEYRRLTDEERADYHRAIQLLKADLSVPPNRYDALSAIHQGIVTTSAHGGPNFLAFHRVYLLMYENALREKVPSVTVPFWDSTLDESMFDPTQSIIFTETFMGGGNGLVRTGPFANWGTLSGPLTRNIGMSGQLFRREDMERVQTLIRLEQITEPNAPVNSSLEFFHNGVHLWIDGQMGSLNTAAHDPVFWMHHAYVDYIWEMFRRNQRNRGIDPSQDYPTRVSDPMHMPGVQMGLSNFRNMDGLNDMFTQFYYTYEPSPDCSVFYPDCGSPYLRCMEVSGRARCVSVDMSMAPMPSPIRQGRGGAPLLPTAPSPINNQIPNQNINNQFFNTQPGQTGMNAQRQNTNQFPENVPNTQQSNAMNAAQHGSGNFGFNQQTEQSQFFENMQRQMNTNFMSSLQTGQSQTVNTPRINGDTLQRFQAGTPQVGDRPNTAQQDIRNQQEIIANQQSRFLTGPQQQASSTRVGSERTNGQGPNVQQPRVEVVHSMQNAMGANQANVNRISASVNTEQTARNSQPVNSVVNGKQGPREMTGTSGQGIRPWTGNMPELFVSLTRQRNGATGGNVSGRQISNNFGNKFIPPGNNDPHLYASDFITKGSSIPNRKGNVVLDSTMQQNSHFVSADMVSGDKIVGQVYTKGQQSWNKPSPLKSLSKARYGDSKRRPKRQVLLSRQGRQSHQFSQADTMSYLKNMSAGPDLSRCPAIPVSRGYQNTFNINGKSDIRQWVYIPVKIVYQRPPTYGTYHSFPILDGEPNEENDIYSPNAYVTIKDFLLAGKPASYSKCGAAQDSGAGKVYINSKGINYMGTYKEYAVVDHRLAISIATAYVAVKSPALGATEVFLSAYDSCGRVCQPFCRSSGSSGFSVCSGAFRITSDNPKLYGMSYGEAVSYLWHFSQGGGCPQLEDDIVQVQFHCSFRDAWPFRFGNSATPTTAGVAGEREVTSGGIGNALANLSKPVQACDLGNGCIASTNCGACVDGRQYACVGSCAVYTTCRAGNHFMQRCKENSWFDQDEERCVPGVCLDQSLQWWYPHMPNKSQK